MCARPVHVSVTVMDGHENVRNSSKDSKNTPQDLSNLRTSAEVWNKLSSMNQRTHHGTLWSWKWPM